MAAGNHDNDEKKGDEKKPEEKKEELKKEEKKAPVETKDAAEKKPEEKKEEAKKEEKKEEAKKEEKTAEEKREEKKEAAEKKEEAKKAVERREEKKEAIEKRMEEKKPANGEKVPYKFLFVSLEALIGDLAWQVKEEGNEVKYYIRDKSEKDVAGGFVEKVDDWKAHKDWADVIVFDDIGFGQVADELRKEGKAVVGGSVYADKLEDDREFGQEELKKVGVNVLPHWDFKDFDAAIEFVQKNPGRYVVKPNGEAQNEKELAYVGQEEDGNDVINILQHYKKSWAKKLNDFQLQKYAQGVEVAVGAFFNGKEFVGPIFVNFEHKKMFPGDIGPNTGEMGTSSFWAPSNKLFRETLERMEASLAASGYVGYIDLNCIANAKGIYPLEFTARFGYPTISLQLEGMVSPLGDFFYALAKGEQYDLKVRKGFQVCVVIAVPPFPFTDPAAFRRYSEDAIILFKKPNLEGVHIGDVKYVEGDWRLSGQSGYALVITGSGQTMDDARKQAYKRVENVMIPNMFYRTDIGERWVRDSDMLHMWGYLY